MCVVSNVYDFAKWIPQESWNNDLYVQFLDLLRKVEEIDRKLNQPDCENPAKAAFLKDVEARLKRLEEKAGVPPDSLLGSTLLPAVMIIGVREVQLGEIVARAHKDSGLSVAQWNALPELEREALIAKAVYSMRAEASRFSLGVTFSGLQLSGPGSI